ARDPPPAAAPRLRTRRSLQLAAQAPDRARPAAGPAAAATATGSPRSRTAKLRSRTAAPPTPAYPPRAGLPSPPRPRYRALAPPSRPLLRYPVGPRTTAPRPLPLTQSGASSPICPYQVLSHPPTSAAAV